MGIGGGSCPRTGTTTTQGKRTAANTQVDVLSRITVFFTFTPDKSSVPRASQSPLGA